MDRALLLATWDEFWATGLWCAPLGKAVADLTAAQASWRPPGVAGKRHCIWEIVNHINFWRDVSIKRSTGSAGPSPEEVQQRNFEMPGRATEAEWEGARKRLEENHRRVRDAIADERVPLDRLRYLVPHDSYHLGQIMQLRAMIGLPPIE